VRLFDNSDISALTGDVRLYLPGWATDYRVFEGSQKRDPKGDSPLLIKKQTRLEGASVDLYVKTADSADIPYLTDLIATSAAKWHLVGLSLGGFIAHELAVSVPEKITNLTMIGVRESYPGAVCRAMQRQLRQDSSALLADFWVKAFGSEAAIVRPSQEISTDVLSRGLDYLAGYSWDNGGSVSCPVTCIHGEMDLIAPVSEAQGLSSRKGWGFQVLAGQAHVPSGCGGEDFLSSNCNYLVMDKLRLNHE